MPEPTQPPTPDPTPAKDTSTPDETPSKPPKRPQKANRTDTEYSSTSDMADEDDPGYQSRSRSQSRRRRRQNQRQRQAASKADAGNGASAESMAAIGEGDELQQEPTSTVRQPGQKLVSSEGCPGLANQRIHADNDSCRITLTHPMSTRCSPLSASSLPQNPWMAL